MGVHYLPGTGLGAKVRERKIGGRKLALMELGVYSRNQTFKKSLWVKDASTEQIQEALGTQQGM